MHRTWLRQLCFNKYKLLVAYHWKLCISVETTRKCDGKKNSCNSKAYLVHYRPFHSLYSAAVAELCFASVVEFFVRRPSVLLDRVSLFLPWDCVPESHYCNADEYTGAVGKNCRNNRKAQPPLVFFVMFRKTFKA
jgi:hypothetical protein